MGLHIMIKMSAIRVALQIFTLSPHARPSSRNTNPLSQSSTNLISSSSNPNLPHSTVANHCKHSPLHNANCGRQSKFLQCCLQAPSDGKHLPMIHFLCAKVYFLLIINLILSQTLLFSFILLFQSLLLELLNN